MSGFEPPMFSTRRQRVGRSLLPRETTKPLADLPADFDAQLKAVGY